MALQFLYSSWCSQICFPMHNHVTYTLVPTWRHYHYKVITLISTKRLSASFYAAIKLMQWPNHLLSLTLLI